MTTLRSYLAATGDKQEYLAKRIGISQPYLSQLMAGARRPSLTLAIRIEQLTSGAVPAASWASDAPLALARCVRRRRQR